MNDTTEARTKIEELRKLLKRMQAHRYEMQRKLVEFNEEMLNMLDRMQDQDEIIEFIKRKLDFELERLGKDA